MCVCVSQVSCVCVCVCVRRGRGRVTVRRERVLSILLFSDVILFGWRVRSSFVLFMFCLFEWVVATVWFIVVLFCRGG